MTGLGLLTVLARTHMLGIRVRWACFAAALRVTRRLGGQAALAGPWRSCIRNCGQAAGRQLTGLAVILSRRNAATMPELDSLPTSTAGTPLLAKLHGQCLD